ncbi:hypothetical protein [Dysgonomonas alginatilytica]|nr:hypothetical protein [Dysgonomonas alginatilytica]
MKKTIKLYLLFIFSMLSFISGYAQVGINTENPDEKAILEIVSSDKGVLVPRMTEVERDLIKPSAINQQSLLIFNTDEDCFNYWHKIDKEWKSVCGKIGKAEFEITDCKAVTVSGQYLSATALTSTNYITVPVKVTKVGTYTITAMPDPANGYYFTTSGEFLATGTYNIIVPGAGTPTNYTTNGQLGNDVKISLNDVLSSCSVSIIIEDSRVKPLYSMTCGSTRVNGVYKVNTPLNGTNTITMTLAVDPTATGASYIITTNTVDGISFAGSGILIVGTNQTVTLYGTGTPTSIDSKRMTITSNSKSDVATCSATVVMAYTKKKILSIGTYTNSYGYNFSGTAYSNQLLTTQTNFGTQANSLIKAEGFDFISPGDFAPSLAQLQTALNQKPDIVILGVWWNPTVQMADLLVTYLANGGVMLAFMEEDGGTRILQRLFANTSISGNLVNAAGAVYRYPFTNDEILNGPFGDIRGLQWGEDASQTRAMYNLPSSEISIYSNDQDVSTQNAGTGGITAFKHNTLNLIFVSDGGFNSATSNAPSDMIICPFNINASKFPIPKTNYGRGATKYSVYNSIFTANALAWAIKTAQFGK